MATPSAARAAVPALGLMLALVLTPNMASAANSGGTAKPNTSDYTGAYSTSGNAANGNISIDSKVTGSAYGGYAHGNTTDNTVTISGGTIGGAVYGGFSSQGGSVGNTVTISGGTITGSVQGGFGGDGTVTGNTVIISGGSIRGNVYGGSSASGSVTGNTVIYSGGTVTYDLIGGKESNGSSDVRTNNTLEIRDIGLSAQNIKNFQHLHFYLPGSVKANDVALSLTNAVDISTPAGKGATTVGVGIMGGGSTLAVGDSVTLIKSAVSLTADANMKNTTTGMSGISKIYDFDLITTDKELQAKVKGSKNTDETIRKSPAEAKAASVTLVTQGADLIAGQGMSSARQATAAGAAGAGGPGNLGVAGFGAANGGASTYNTGSHVDVKGFSLMAGLAKRLPLSGVDALVGAFFEAGWGSYDSYNDKGSTEIKGWGNSRYYGGGLMGRLELTEGAARGLYTEASFRIGGLSSDYNSDDLNPALGRADYNTQATYYGAHAGLGYIWQFNEQASLDLYGKYFWTHTTGSNVTILGDDVKFDAVNSHRTRLGGRFSYAVNEHIAPYVGAAWEYEFDGDARSTVAGQSVAAPSLKGSTGVGELGISWKPAVDSGFSVDLGAQGYVGMRQGVSGSLQLKFEF